MRAGEESRILASVQDAYDDLSGWEQSFVESIADQLANGRKLTEKQRDKLVAIYEEKVLGY